MTASDPSPLSAARAAFERNEVPLALASLRQILKRDARNLDAIEEVYGGPVSENHTANFTDAMKSRKQPISDVWSHNRMLEICHLSNIAMRLGRELKWDPAKREIIGDPQANSFLARESRKGFEIEM